MTVRRLLAPTTSLVCIVTALLVLGLVTSGCAAFSTERLLGTSGAGQEAADYGSRTWGVAPAPAQKMLSAQAPGESAGGDQSKAAPSAEGRTGGSGGSAAAQPRMVIRTKSMTSEVKDAKKAAKSVEALAKKHGGYLTDVYIVSQGDEPMAAPMPEEGSQPTVRAPSGSRKAGPFTATVTAKVPAKAFEAFLAEVRGLGTVETERQSAQDVTQQHVDLTARLKNLRAQEARLRQFFSAAKKVSEMLLIERELGRVRGEIEAMQAQLDNLEQSVALATLTATLHEPAAIISPGSSRGWGIIAAFTDAVRNFVDVVNFLIRLTGGLLPFIILVVLAVLIVRWYVRRAMGKRKTAASAAKAGGKHAGTNDRSLATRANAEAAGDDEERGTAEAADEDR